MRRLRVFRTLLPLALTSILVGSCGDSKFSRDHTVVKFSYAAGAQSASLKSASGDLSAKYQGDRLTLMVYGATEGEWFAAPMGGKTETRSFIVKNGSWKFKAVQWLGSENLVPPLHCAWTEGFLEGGEAVVEMTLSGDTCEDLIFADIADRLPGEQIKPLRLWLCEDIFAITDPSNGCNGGVNYSTSWNSARINMLGWDNKNASGAFNVIQSTCGTATTNKRVDLPVVIPTGRFFNDNEKAPQSFPFEVVLYSSTDCSGPPDDYIAFPSFHFEGWGIEGYGLNLHQSSARNVLHISETRPGNIELFACDAGAAASHNQYGSGTLTDPYQICNEAQLIQLSASCSSNPCFTNTHFVLTDNIFMTGAFTPIGGTSNGFSGSIDGYGYGIYDLVIGQDSNHRGFIGQMTTGSSVTNLSFYDPVMNDDTAFEDSYAGILAGKIENNATVTAVDFYNPDIGSTTALGNFVGIITGHASGSSLSISDVYISEPYVEGNNQVGGAIGFIDGGTFTDITVSASTGTFDIHGGATYYAGGISSGIGATNTTTITRNYVLASGRTWDRNNDGPTGGLFGDISTAATTCTITDSYLDIDTITGNHNIAGFAVTLNGTGITVNDTIIVADAFIDTGANHTGGFASSIISATVNDALILANYISSGSGGVGGLAATVSGATINESSVLSLDVTSTPGGVIDVGGLIGKLHTAASTITKNNATIVSGLSSNGYNSGGLIGNIQVAGSTVTENWADVFIDDASATAGGLIGNMSVAGTINDNYSHVSFDSANGGGFVGTVSHASASFNRNYAVILANGVAEFAAVNGVTFSQTNNAVKEVGLVKCGTVGNCTAVTERTEAQMQNSSVTPFTAWNFSTIWANLGGYHFLQNNLP